MVVIVAMKISLRKNAKRLSLSATLLLTFASCVACSSSARQLPESPGEACEGYYARHSLNWQMCVRNRHIAMHRNDIKSEVIQKLSQTQTPWERQLAQAYRYRK